MNETEFPITTAVSPVKLRKAFAGMFFTLSPMVSAAGPVQPEKTGYGELSMLVQLSALKVMADNPAQLLKALFPMVETFFPIVNDVIPLQPRNAYAPIVLTESGIIVEPVKPAKL